MKLRKAFPALVLTGALLLTALGGCAPTLGTTVPKDPTAILIWHYYNGAQQEIFSQLVQEFNETVGREQSIVVEAHSYGKIGDLTQKVEDAIYGKVGAAEVPDVFAAYADTAYKINQAGKVADISQYMTQEEIDSFVTAYLDEGRLDGEGFKIFPTAKSAELLSLNKTEWDAFAAATSATEDGLTTWEGIAGLAEAYYLWTDGLTPAIPDDGKAFFGRDAFANYIIIGSKQLGVELFQVQDGTVTLQVEHDVMRRLWDNYYVPYISGCYAAYGKFRSDDLRTGDLAAFVGATSGATYFPSEVTRADGSTYPIEGKVYPLPNFEGTDPMAVQQGAGMVVTKSTEERERAAVRFLQWLSQPQQNVRFALASGYLPVTKAANDKDVVMAAAEQSGQVMTPMLRDSIEIGVDMASSYTLYTTKPFGNGYEARTVVEHSMQDKAAEDRVAVQALIAGGVPRSEAVAQINTDENFAAWLQSFTAALKQAAGQS